MGENWWLESGPFSYGGPARLFELALKHTTKDQTDKKIIEYTEKLDQLKAEESEQRLTLLNSAITGETDLVASIKLSELEQDIQRTEQNLLNAQLDQKHNFQLAVDLFDRMAKYQARNSKYWPDDLDSEEN